MIGTYLHACHARDLARGDIARGVNHGRIVTGPPVRVLRVRCLSPIHYTPCPRPRTRCENDCPDAAVRVSYVIVGDGGTGWRDLPPDRGVTVQRERETDGAGR